MRRGQADAAGAKMLLDLERAAGVGRSQQIGPALERTLVVRRATLVGALGRDQIADAGAAATLLSIGELDELDPRDPREQLARLAALPLRVRQVTRIVVGHASRDRVPSRDRW